MEEKRVQWAKVFPSWQEKCNDPGLRNGRREELMGLPGRTRLGPGYGIPAWGCQEEEDALGVKSQA